MTRIASATVGVLLLAACWPVGIERGPAEPAGPTLVMDVANRSSDQLTLGYEFVTDTGTGGGEGLVGACEHQAQSWGPIFGTFTISIDGAPVIDARVAPGTPDDGFLVVRIEVAPDGEAHANGPPRWTRLAPGPGTQPIPGCG